TGPGLSGPPAAGQPARPAVLTAAVVPGAPDAATFAASFPAMARFFGSDPGRAALSRSGRAGTVALGAVSSRDGVIYLSLSDSAAGPGQAVAPDYWRAILTLRSHLVTLSVMSLADRALTSVEKRQILDAFVGRMRAANAGAAAAGFAAGIGLRARGNETVRNSGFHLRVTGAPSGRVRDKFDGCLDRHPGRRALGRWRAAAERAGAADPATLRALRGEGRQLRRQIDRVLHVAEGPLARGDGAS